MNFQLFVGYFKTNIKISFSTSMNNMIYLKIRTGSNESFKKSIKIFHSIIIIIITIENKDYKYQNP